MDESTIRRVVRDELAGMSSNVRELHRVVTGGENPENGLVLKVDRLVQAENRRKLWIGAAVGAAFSALASMVVSWVR